MDHETFECYPHLGTGPRYVSSTKLYAVLRPLDRPAPPRADA